MQANRSISTRFRLSDYYRITIEIRGQNRLWGIYATFSRTSAVFRPEVGNRRNTGPLESCRTSEGRQGLFRTSGWRISGHCPLSPRTHPASVSWISAVGPSPIWKDIAPLTEAPCRAGMKPQKPDHHRRQPYRLNPIGPYVPETAPSSR